MNTCGSCSSNLHVAEMLDKRTGVLDSYSSKTLPLLLTAFRGEVFVDNLPPACSPRGLSLLSMLLSMLR